MKFCKVTAIFPNLVLTDVEKNLVALGVGGMTVSKAYGFGEYRNFYAKDWMSDCARVEVFTDAEKVNEIVSAIARTVRQGLTSDGVIAVLPVERFIHIREFSEG